MNTAYRRKFDIRIAEGARVATAGSDFAQTIRRELITRNCNYYDAEPAPPMLLPRRHSDFGFGLFSARYGTINTVAQLRQLAERAFGLRTFEDTIWETAGRFYDVFRPVVEPNGYISAEEVGHCRNSHLRNVRRLLEEADVFIFALGKAETWRARADGLVHPLRPGTVAGAFDPEKYEFVQYSADDVVADFEAFMDIVRAANADIQFILIDAPAPVPAAAIDEQMLNATEQSRDVLRVAAEELYARYDCVDYFPSRESTDAPFGDDRVETADQQGPIDDDFNRAMDEFFNEHGEGSMDMIAQAEDPELRLAREMAEALMTRQQEICDEMLLEAQQREE